MRLILHLGHAKCGSTAIQKFLVKNRKYFLKNRVFVPDNELRMPDDIDFRWYDETPRDFFEMLIQENKVEQLNEKLREISNSDAFDTVIISAENLINHLCDTEIHQLFRSCFSDIKVLYYLKPQDTFLVSSWQQWGYKSGISLKEYILQAKKDLYPNYYLIVKGLEEIYGKKNLTVGLVLKEVLHEGDLLKDFLFRCNIDLEKTDFSQEVANQSLSLLLCNVLVKEPKLFDTIHDESLKNRLISLTNNDPLLYEKFDDLLSVEERREILEHFRPDNSYLYYNYFLHLEFDQIFSVKTQNINKKRDPNEYYQQFILLLMRSIKSLKRDNAKKM